MGYAELGYRGLREEFFQSLASVIERSWANAIGMIVDSDQEIETYKWLGMSPQMREWVGGRLAKKLRVESFQIRNLPFESTLYFDDDDLRREKTAQFRVRIQDLALRAGTHWNKLITDLLIANGNGYDGKAFFATNHVSGDSGTLTNLLTATEVPSANVATAAAPTASEMAAIIMELTAYMMGWKDDQGEPINTEAKDFIVMVPQNMNAALRQALTAQYLVNGVSNIALEAVRAGLFTIRPVVNPRLTTTTEMYAFIADRPIKAIILQDEVGIRTSMKDEVFDNRMWKFGIDARRNAGYGEWNTAAKLTLS